MAFQNKDGSDTRLRLSLFGEGVTASPRRRLRARRSAASDAFDPRGRAWVGVVWSGEGDDDLCLFLTGVRNGFGVGGDGLCLALEGENGLKPVSGGGVSGARGRGRTEGRREGVDGGSAGRCFGAFEGPAGPSLGALGGARAGSLALALRSFLYSLYFSADEVEVDCSQDERYYVPMAKVFASS